VSNDIKPPDGVVFVFLPPYTPEPRPAERPWPLANEAVANNSFKDIFHLEEVLAKRSATPLTPSDPQPSGTGGPIK
jgi:transposase